MIGGGSEVEGGVEAPANECTVIVLAGKPNQRLDRFGGRARLMGPSGQVCLCRRASTLPVAREKMGTIYQKKKQATF